MILAVRARAQYALATEDLSVLPSNMNSKDPDDLKAFGMSLDTFMPSPEEVRNQLGLSYLNETPEEKAGEPEAQAPGQDAIDADIIKFYMEQAEREREGAR
jgi:hypothetical protein